MRFEGNGIKSEMKGGQQYYFRIGLTLHQHPVRIQFSGEPAEYLQN